MSRSRGTMNERNWNKRPHLYWGGGICFVFNLTKSKPWIQWSSSSSTVVWFYSVLFKSEILQRNKNKVINGLDNLESKVRDYVIKIMLKRLYLILYICLIFIFDFYLYLSVWVFLWLFVKNKCLKRFNRLGPTYFVNLKELVNSQSKFMKFFTNILI